MEPFRPEEWPRFVRFPAFQGILARGNGNAWRGAVAVFPGPEGAQQISPGQRPGSAATTPSPALNGRDNRAVGRRVCRPFRAPLVGALRFPERCPGLMCSAPSGPGRNAPDPGSRRHFPNRVESFERSWNESWMRDEDLMRRRRGEERAMGKSADQESKPTREHRRRTRRAPSPVSGGRLSSAGAKIVGAFEAAIALTRLGEPLERHFTVRIYKADFTPRAYEPDDVRRVRGLLGMSQVLFARFLGVDANTVRSWEQGTRPPSPIARRFMDEIENDPEHWRERMVQEAVEVAIDPANR